MSFLKFFHVLAVVIWVGGMFFAYMILRAAAAEILQPPDRLRLWDNVFARFFNWVWLSVIILLITGFCMVFLHGGLAYVSSHVHLMALFGMGMVSIFIYVFFLSFRRFRLKVASQDWPGSGAMLATIRRLVGLNLVIGLSTIATAVLGGAAGI